MATARPFAYNTGMPISGTIQVGNLSIGAPTSGFTNSPQYWNGPDEELGYVIAAPVSGNTQPTPLSATTASVGFYRTSTFDNNEFIQLSEIVAYEYGNPQTFLSASDASTWLTNNGFWNSYSPVVTTTLTNTPTPTNTPTNTITPSVTSTNTPTNTVTPTKTPTVTPTTTPQYVTSGLILYYDPSNLSSYPGTGTTVNDLSGNGLNGTMSNITFQTQSFNFNGSNSQVSIANNSLLQPGTGDWTMEVWINVTAFNGDSIVLGKFSGGFATNLSYSIRINSSGQIYAQLGDGIGNVLNSTLYQMTLNTWTHVMYVFKNISANTLETYINGSSIGTTSHGLSSILNNSNPLYLGSFNGGQFSQYFFGNEGIVRLYNAALTNAQVLENYTNTSTKYIPLTPTQTPTNTPTPSTTPLYYILAQSGDILTAQNGDLIEYQH
jgi:Concanavalin A-like lectin/glucanases superfamily